MNIVLYGATGKSIGQIIATMVGKLSENISVRCFVRQHHQNDSAFAGAISTHLC